MTETVRMTEGELRQIVSEKIGEDAWRLATGNGMVAVMEWMNKKGWWRWDIVFDQDSSGIGSHVDEVGEDGWGYTSPRTIWAIIEGRTDIPLSVLLVFMRAVENVDVELSDESSEIRIGENINTK